jgi:hypothetical protein
VDGFHHVAFEPLGPRSWRVRDRGILQTIRFDRATLDGVDFSRSRGVVGQRHELGSLFVALDESDPTPVVALASIAPSGREPRADVPYLVESRWRVYALQREPGRLRFATQGYGPGDATWFWPWPGTALVEWRTTSGRTGRFYAPVDAADLVHLRLPQLTGTRADVVVTARRRAPDGR